MRACSATAASALRLNTMLRSGHSARRGGIGWCPFRRIRSCRRWAVLGMPWSFRGEPEGPGSTRLSGRGRGMRARSRVGCQPGFPAALSRIGTGTYRRRRISPGAAADCEQRFRCLLYVGIDLRRLAGQRCAQCLVLLGTLRVDVVDGPRASDVAGARRGVFLGHGESGRRCSRGRDLRHVRGMIDLRMGDDAGGWGAASPGAAKPLRRRRNRFMASTGQIRMAGTRRVLMRQIDHKPIPPRACRPNASLTGAMPDRGRHDGNGWGWRARGVSAPCVLPRDSPDRYSPAWRHGPAARGGRRTARHRGRAAGSALRHSGPSAPRCAGPRWSN